MKIFYKEELSRKLEYIWYHTPVFPLILTAIQVLLPIITANLIYTIIGNVIIALIILFTEEDLEISIGFFIFGMIISIFSFLIYSFCSLDVKYSDPKPLKNITYIQDEEHIVVNIDGNDNLIHVDGSLFYKLQTPECKPMYRNKREITYYGKEYDSIEVDCK